MSAALMPCTLTITTRLRLYRSQLNRRRRPVLNSTPASSDDRTWCVQDDILHEGILFESRRQDFLPLGRGECTFGEGWPRPTGRNADGRDFDVQILFEIVAAEEHYRESRWPDWRRHQHRPLSLSLSFAPQTCHCCCRHTPTAPIVGHSRHSPLRILPAIRWLAAFILRRVDCQRL